MPIHEIMCLKEYSLPSPVCAAAAAVPEHLPLTHESSSPLPCMFFVILVQFLLLTRLLLKGESYRTAGYKELILAGNGMQIQVKI